VAELTPFQTVGPFFEVALPAPGQRLLAGPDAKGRRVRIEGTVRDGAGAPVPDGLIETWQADAGGCYRHPEDQRSGSADPELDGFGRVPTDDGGRFWLETVMPGPVPGPRGALQAPHVVVGVLARGVLTRLVTRIYFEGEAANDADPVLREVPPHRRPTLIAQRIGDGRFQFDIVLQGGGANETVFFDV